VLSVPPTVKVYLAPGATDMRKSFDTLAAAARTVLEKDPFSGHLFAFCGRSRRTVKVLLWDGTGFSLLAKRLGRGTFAWPGAPSDGGRCVELRAHELAALLAGLDLGRSEWKSWGRGPERAAS
jgi:transposase